MLVLHVPADGSRATAISFPRDSYVDIPGYGKDKLNAAYPDGYQSAADQGANEVAAESAGIQVLISTLNQLTGAHDQPLRPGQPARLLPHQQRPRRGRRLPQAAAKEPNSGIDLPAGVSTDRRARRRSRSSASATASPTAGRPRPHPAPAVLPVGRVPQGAVGRHAAQPRAGSRALLKAVSSSLLIDPDLDPLVARLAAVGPVGGEAELLHDPAGRGGRQQPGRVGHPRSTRTR